MEKSINLKTNMGESARSNNNMIIKLIFGHLEFYNKNYNFVYIFLLYYSTWCMGIMHTHLGNYLMLNC